MNFKYKPSRYIQDKVDKFAEDRLSLSKNLYKWRGESSLGKMIEDLKVGCYGEYAVFNYLKSLGIKCSRPDLKIYETRKKSFDQDLKTNKHLLHVKSQSHVSAKRYGQSWLFQRSDKLYKAPLKNEYMVFTNVNLNTLEVEVLGFVNCQKIKELNLWGECKVPRYRHSKCAIYLKDLEPYGIIKNNIKE